MEEPSLVLDPADLAEPSDVNNQTVEEQDTTEADSSADENNAPEVADEETQTDSDTDSGEQTPAEEQDEANQPRGKADERKEQLNTEIRDLVAKRNQIRQEVEAYNSQTYAPQSIEELVDEGMSEAEARVQALEQKIELSDYNNRVAEVQLTIGHESEKIISDFPMFDPNSEQFKPQRHAQAAELLRQNLIADPNTGQIIGSNVSPYQLYKTIADAYQDSATENQIKGQKANEKMLAAVDAPSSSAPKQGKEDLFLKGLLGDKYQE